MIRFLVVGTVGGSRWVGGKSFKNKKKKKLGEGRGENKIPRKKN
jgi:hypothetical protein